MKTTLVACATSLLAVSAQGASVVIADETFDTSKIEFKGAHPYNPDQTSEDLTSQVSGGSILRMNGALGFTISAPHGPLIQTHELSGGSLNVGHRKGTVNINSRGLMTLRVRPLQNAPDLPTKVQLIANTVELDGDVSVTGVLKIDGTEVATKEDLSFLTAGFQGAQNLALGTFAQDSGFRPSSNNIAAGSGSFTQTDNSASFGSNRLLFSDASITVGTANRIGTYSIDGQNFNPAGASNAALFGRNLSTITSNSTTVGTYNLQTNALFTVGNGTAAQRSNAFEVKQDGSVIISKPQGNISMGIYGE